MSKSRFLNVANMSFNAFLSKNFRIYSNVNALTNVSMNESLEDHKAVGSLRKTGIPPTSENHKAT